MELRLLSMTSFGKRSVALACAALLASCSGAAPPAAEESVPGPSRDAKATTAPSVPTTGVVAEPEPSGAPSDAPPPPTADAGEPPKQPKCEHAPGNSPGLGRRCSVSGIRSRGALGIDLDREFKAVGVRGVTKYKTATYIPTWASTPDLELYLSQFHPDLVLITLGANELLIPDPSARIPTIHRLVARLGGRPCVCGSAALWHGARPALLPTTLSGASCAPCAYLDSTALFVPDLPRTPDHIHPSMDARKTWAKAVFGWLAEHRAQDGARPWDLQP